MVAPAFGFSVGDFVSLIGVLTKILKALRDTDGAGANYQQTTAELDAIVSVLKRVQALQPNARNGDIVAQIHPCGHISHIPLSRFYRNVKKFEPQLDLLIAQTGSTRNKFSKLRKSARWALTIEDEVQKLKTALSANLHVISLLLQLDAYQRHTTLETSAENVETIVAQLVGDAKTLKEQVISQLATRSDVAPIMPFLKRIYNCQTSQTKDFENLTEEMRTLNVSLSAKFSHFENSLHAFQDNSGNHRPSMPQELPSFGWQVVQPLSTVTGENAETTSHSSSLVRAALRIEDLLRAFRRYINELILVLLAISPVFNLFLRNLSALCRSPTMLLLGNMELEDALGRVMSLPYAHFRDWPVMEAKLRCVFAGLPGERHILKNRFSIIAIKGGTDHVISKDTWHASVSPGTKMFMSMLIGSSATRESSCPRCLSTHASAKQDEWVACVSCSMTYKIMERQLGDTPSPDSDIYTNMDKTGPRENADREERDTRTIARDRRDIIQDSQGDSEVHNGLDDVKSFKRVHLFNYGQEDLGDSDAANRQRIRKSILDGNIDMALKFTNIFYPHVLEDSRNKNIHFRLKCRKFIEMMRRYSELSTASPVDDVNAAASLELPDESSFMNQNELLSQTVAYGQELQQTYRSDTSPQMKKQLSDIFALMAYSDPMQSPVGDLLDPRGRAQIAEDLNHAIIG